MLKEYFKPYFKIFDNKTKNELLLKEGYGDGNFYNLLKNDYNLFFRFNSQYSRIKCELLFIDKKNQVSLSFFEYKNDNNDIVVNTSKYVGVHEFDKMTDQEIEAGLDFIEKINKQGCIHLLEFAVDDKTTEVLDKLKIKKQLETSTLPRVKVKHVVYNNFFDTLKNHLDKKNVKTIKP